MRSRPVLATVCDTKDTDSARQLFGAAATVGRWEGDYCLLCSGLSPDEKDWFDRRGVVVRDYGPTLDPTLWTALRGGNKRPQTLLLKFRLFSEEFRPWPTVVYLDTDVLIRRPINRLGRVRGFAATPDVQEEFSKLFYPGADLESIAPAIERFPTAFNSGVFAFSWDAVPEGAYERMVALASAHLDKTFLVDQPFLNLMFADRWKRFGPSYNLLLPLWERHASRWMRDVFRGSRILHFAGPSKPSNPECDWHSEWLANLARSKTLESLASAPRAAPTWWVPDLLIDLALRIARSRRHGQLFLLQPVRTGLNAVGRFLLRFAKQSYRLLAGLGVANAAHRLARPLTLRAFRGNLAIDASTACALQCVSCPQTSGDIGRTIHRGVLDPEVFSRFVDRDPKIRSIEFSNWGEPFMNPRLPAILERCWRAGIRPTFANGTNLTHLDDVTADALVKYGAEEVTCAIDGVTQETYQKYRRGGNLATVLDNVRRINRFKKAYVSKLPRLTWQFILFRHNQHEFDAAKTAAGDLGMEFRAKLAWGNRYGINPAESCDHDIASAATGYRDREHWKEVDPAGYFDWFCMSLWRRPWINYDGRLLGCACNYWGDYGNAFVRPLESVLNNEKMRYARAMMMGLRPSRADVPCASCEIYHERLERRCFVSEQSILYAKSKELSRGLRR